MRSGEDATGSSRLDGGLTDVVRVGETIHRSTSHGTQAVHALLAHLELVGFEGAPRVLGFDAEGREVLSFIVGDGPSHTDDELALVAQLVRELHDATAAFAGPPDLQWQFMVGAPQQGDVVCHNDLSPDNTIYGPDSTPRAFIDWDLATPAPRIWDVAWAVYRFIPLYDDATCERLGYPVPSRAARLRIFCDAYELDDREALLPTVCQRIRVLYDTARVWGEAGRSGWRDVWHDTRGEQWLRGLRYVEEKHGEWERDLTGG